MAEEASVLSKFYLEKNCIRIKIKSYNDSL